MATVPPTPTLWSDLKPRGDQKKVVHKVDLTQFLHRCDFAEDGNRDANPVALIVLNCPIRSFDFYQRLWEHSDYCLLADGGANRVYDLMMDNFPDQDEEWALDYSPPAQIHGDLDSIDPAVRLAWKQIGIRITHDPEQNSTDFGKAVREAHNNLHPIRHLLVIGSLGGRVDQGLGLLGELYREQQQRPECRLWLFSESSVSVILRRGTTALHTPMAEGLLERSVGILPLYGPAVITTHGLEWDVAGWSTQMGGQMSTSNHIRGDVVTVTTDNEVLFTVESKIDR